MVGQVLILGIAKIPNFIALDSLAGQVAKGLLLEFQAGFTQFAGELLNGVLGYAGNPHRGANRATIDKAANYRTALFFCNRVHAVHYA